MRSKWGHLPAGYSSSQCLHWNECSTQWKSRGSRLHNITTLLHPNYSWSKITGANKRSTKEHHSFGLMLVSDVFGALPYHSELTCSIYMVPLAPSGLCFWSPKLWNQFPLHIRQIYSFVLISYPLILFVIWSYSKTLYSWTFCKILTQLLKVENAHS